MPCGALAGTDSRDLNAEIPHIIKERRMVLGGGRWVSEEGARRGSLVVTPCL